MAPKLKLKIDSHSRLWTQKRLPSDEIEEKDECPEYQLSGIMANPNIHVA